jgi:hypothetical protein
MMNDLDTLQMAWGTLASELHFYELFLAFGILVSTIATLRKARVL